MLVLHKALHHERLSPTPQGHQQNTYLASIDVGKKQHFVPICPVSEVSPGALGKISTFALWLKFIPVPMGEQDAFEPEARHTHERGALVKRLPPCSSNEGWLWRFCWTGRRAFNADGSSLSSVSCIFIVIAVLSEASFRGGFARSCSMSDSCNGACCPF